MDLGNRDIAGLLTNYGGIAIATAPLAAGLMARIIFGKSRVMTLLVRVSVAWMPAKLFLAPHVDQMQQTVLALNSLIHGNGYN